MALLILRVVLWVIVPLGLIVIAVGPSRFRRGFGRLWSWVNDQRQEPIEVLNHVVREHEKSVRQLKDALKQSEVAQEEILRNLRKSEEKTAELEKEAFQCVAAGDDFGARAALYKLNLERLAGNGFRTQLERQASRIDQVRRRLHLLELQLRQYEVGRSILLSQLAEAKTVEQQYALANEFDPFSAVASWNRAEQTVEETSQNARAVEQVLNDASDLPLNHQAVHVDPALLDRQLADLKDQLCRNN